MNLETRLRQKIRSQAKSKGTADAYWNWVKRFLLFAREKRGEWVKPEDMGERQVAIFLSHLANVEQVSANTQNQSFSAICYLYRHVLDRPLVNVQALRAKRPDTVSDILEPSEIAGLFGELSGVPLLVARMMYASGFRIGELGNIRLKDISFDRKQITVKRGKGGKDRVVGFPVEVHNAVRQQIASVEVLWRHDREAGFNGVSLPDAYGRKCPSARMDLAWWYLLPSDTYSRCPESGQLLRHHRDMANVGRQICDAAKRAGIRKRVTSHVLRHSYASHSLESGVPVHFVQKLLGHESIETTERYLHATANVATQSVSPIAALETALENPKDLKREHQQVDRPTLRVFAG